MQLHVAENTLCFQLLSRLTVLPPRWAQSHRRLNRNTEHLIRFGVCDITPSVPIRRNNSTDIDIKSSSQELDANGILYLSL
ncbi:hypothetical protein V2G26_000755 [Clonostachys chloroleuca]